MTPRHTVKLAALVASACLIVFAAMAQPAPAAPPDDHVLVTGDEINKTSE